MKPNFRKSIFAQAAIVLAALLIITGASVQAIQAQTDVVETKSPTSVSVNRERGLSMLDDIKDMVKERYYDPNYHGINLDEHFKSAAEKIKKADANWQIFRVLAETLMKFDDSHTRFFPPNRANAVEYGFSMQIIGDNCYVVDVKKGSDAEVEGIKAGDQLVSIGRYTPTRGNLWQLEYFLYSIEPQTELTVKTKSPDNTQRDVTFKARIIKFEDREKERKKHKAEEKEKPYKCSEISPELVACKLYTFEVDKGMIDKMMKEVGTHQKLILDLRGNGGGLIKTLAYLTGCFFDRDVKIGDEKTRKSTVELIAKSQKEKVYKGDLEVLIDSDSASASEIFARTIQLEKRGKIIGDLSAGAVMTSNFFTGINQRGVSDYATYSVFAISLTVGDFVMSNGERLENFGVMPDNRIGPTGTSLAKGYDPVLSYAANSFGVKLSGEQAGQLYFLVKKPEAAADDKPDENGSDE
ncbi:MAG: S41 family peptidase [Pyrinomonadaceae bacterium]